MPAQLTDQLKCLITHVLRGQQRRARSLILIAFVAGWALPQASFAAAAVEWIQSWTESVDF